MDAFDRLQSVIASRIGGDPASSYVAKLHARGTAKIAQKVGEEAVECVIADRGITLDDVRAELTAREGRSGIAEKAARPKE